MGQILKNFTYSRKVPSCSGLGNGNTTDYTFHTDVCHVKHITTIRVINCLAVFIISSGPTVVHLTLTAVKLLSRAIYLGPTIDFAMCYLISRTLYCIQPN